MKILHINTHDSGGAEMAAYRLHQALCKYGHQSEFLTLHNSHKFKDAITFQPRWPSFLGKKLITRMTGNLNDKQIAQALSNNPLIEVFTSPDTIYNIFDFTSTRKVDIIHLHWIGNFIDFKTFFKGNSKPLVWTFHDENPLLGGFHYSEDIAYADSNLRILDDQLKEVKETAIASGNNKIGVICPSNWLKKKAEKSFIKDFSRIVHIPYCLDVESFPLVLRAQARSNFNIPSGTKVFTIVASDLRTHRKGFDIVLQLIPHFNSYPDIKFLIVGDYPQNLRSTQQNIIFLGKVNSLEKLRDIYAASDALLLASRQDNLPNVMLESLIMGCPILGFKVGGIADVIVDNINGLLTSEISANGLSLLMKKFLSCTDSFDRTKIREQAIKRFNARDLVGEVTLFYQSIIQGL